MFIDRDGGNCSPFLPSQGNEKEAKKDDSWVLMLKTNSSNLVSCINCLVCTLKYVPKIAVLVGESTDCKHIVKTRPTGNRCPYVKTDGTKCDELMMEGTKTIPERCSDKLCPNHNPHKLGN